MLIVSVLLAWLVSVGRRNTIDVLFVLKIVDKTKMPVGEAFVVLLFQWRCFQVYKIIQ
ncbi:MULTISPECIES: hypothetical protein [unclassified Acinetobacter]|uniref:hypothetical protein n=1 Tax=unclassified Acinetobacter TaxID=196816 RepID=UPI0015D42FAF|nr:MULTISPECIES: hypothetical protein [unclassified Acinetobacter]